MKAEQTGFADGLEVRHGGVGGQPIRVTVRFWPVYLTLRIVVTRDGGRLCTAGLKGLNVDMLHLICL